MGNYQRTFETKIPRLFELMANKNIKAVAVSEGTEISTSNISDWKSGRSAPGIDSLNLLADFFDVSVDYLLGRETDTPSLSPEELRLIEIYRSFNRDGKDTLTRQAEMMFRLGDYKKEEPAPGELGA